ncbi:MAG: hypothetical protein MUD12_07305 [Spirochaetes bacterium]|jgi:tetratricopeptide (TPR) repeat protein|nr:hypothetical protein [Spirochaetota bacterium]
MRIKRIIPVILVLIVSCSEETCSYWSRLRSANKQSPVAQIEKLRERIKEQEAKDAMSRNTRLLADLYNQLGTKYLESKTWDPAIDALMKAIKYGKSSSEVHYSLGLAYANRGKDAGGSDDIETAESQYSQALEISPDNKRAAYALGILLFYKKNEKDRALRIMESVSANNKKFYESRFALARFYYEMDMPDKSLRTYEELYADLQKLPDSDISREYKNAAKENISALMQELSVQRKK